MLKVCKCAVILRIQTRVFDKTPQSLNEVQIWRVWWQEQQFYSERLCALLHLCTALIACIIEHNPFNPVTQIIIRRTPVDDNAQLLTARTARGLLSAAGLGVDQRTTYFLYFPQNIYRKARAIEALLEKVPAGGQYAAFGRKP